MPFYCVNQQNCKRPKKENESVSRPAIVQKEGLECRWCKADKKHHDSQNTSVSQKPPLLEMPKLDQEQSSPVIKKPSRKQSKQPLEFGPELRKQAASFWNDFEKTTKPHHLEKLDLAFVKEGSDDTSKGLRAHAKVAQLALMQKAVSNKPMFGESPEDKENSKIRMRVDENGRFFITVFRGVAAHGDTHSLKGFQSWSLDENQAQKFAAEMGEKTKKPGRVLKIEVPLESVVQYGGMWTGYYEGKYIHEQEVVVKHSLSDEFSEIHLKTNVKTWDRDSSPTTMFADDIEKAIDPKKFDGAQHDFALRLRG